MEQNVKKLEQNITKLSSDVTYVFDMTLQNMKKDVRNWIEIISMEP